MIFTTECPSCETSFPIDSGKVPDGGVYARCSECDQVFHVDTPAAPEAVAEREVVLPPEAVSPPGVASPPEAASAPEMVAAPDVVPAPADRTEPSPAARAAEFAEPPVLEQPAVADHVATATAPAAAPAFGRRDPKERAARLARVLVSDMIAYHPDRHRRSLSEGTLPQEFDEEIQKSWNEYVDQVGKDVAETTPYFRDALNQVLAQGAEVF